MVLLYPVNGETHLCLTKRASYDGVHSDQVSFPGGKVEPIDADLSDTALRETEEEIGIPRQEIQLLGALSRIYIPPSHFAVQPFIGLMDYQPRFQLQEREATELIQLPLHNFLLQQPEKRTVLVRGHKIEVPSFITGNHVCWGATAIILSEFRALLTEDSLSVS
jgi:8-oxo-dGTP pyrophosphatase MutT (NUDIX family)